MSHQLLAPRRGPLGCLEVALPEGAEGPVYPDHLLFLGRLPQGGRRLPLSQLSRRAEVPVLKVQQGVRLPRGDGRQVDLFS